uniref:Envelope glycoprotein n=1 Tax=Bubo bubo TaxID=30461 RepID=A0A8C0IBX5_BUBBB
MNPPTLLTIIVIWAVGGIATPAYTQALTHQPFKWSIIRWKDQKVLQSVVTAGAPSFVQPRCSFIPVFGCNRNPRDPELNVGHFYLCPSSSPDYCNWDGHYYCAYWGCETIASGWIPKVPDKFLQNLNLTVISPQDPGWIKGKTWGMRYWEEGKDRGGLFLIKKEIAPPDVEPVGPNPVIVNKEPLFKKVVNTTSVSNSTKRVPSFPQEIEATTMPLWKILMASYQFLNTTNPNLTKHCWLCFDVKPPFYEAIGVTSKPRYMDGSNPAQCIWNRKDGQQQGISMLQVSGQGSCLGIIPPQKKHLCKEIINPEREPSADWLLPDQNTKWICSKVGLTPCLSLKVFNRNEEYCIQVVVVPKIIYHPEDYIYNYQTVQEHHSQKREPITALTVATLIAIGAAGGGTGITSLVQQNQKFQSLRAAVDEDLLTIEKSISALETSLRSLSEVVLQNRRGLDLMFLQQGGLCEALKEECCMYADHTGVVRDTMTKLREGLEKRKQEREQQQNWFETLFNKSPWLTTVLSTIAGPLVLLIIGLTFGPCIFNKIISIIKGRLEAAHLMVVKTQYEQTKGPTPACLETHIPKHEGAESAHL